MDSKTWCTMGPARGHAACPQSAAYNGARMPDDRQEREGARGSTRRCRRSRAGSLAGREYGMDYQNLRGWIAAVDELGELERLAGVDSDLELATITELVLRERRPPPAVLYDDIVGYSRGYRVLTGLSNTPKRMALTLRLPTDLDTRGLIQAWRARMETLEPIPPRVVSRGP